MIVLPERIIGIIRKQAKKELPNEACGYLAGKSPEVSKIYQLSNADRSPEHFSLIPEEQFKALKESRSKGLEIIAVYHSHPSTPARMSEEDLRLAADPDMLYVIYSLEQDNIKAFRVADGKITKEEIELR